MEKGTGLPVNLTQFRGIIAILQWWSFNVLVIIMNKWIFQVGNSNSHTCLVPMFVPLPTMSPSVFVL